MMMMMMMMMMMTTTTTTDGMAVSFDEWQPQVIHIARVVAQHLSFLLFRLLRTTCYIALSRANSEVSTDSCLFGAVGHGGGGVGK